MGHYDIDHTCKKCGTIWANRRNPTDRTCPKCNPPEHIPTLEERVEALEKKLKELDEYTRLSFKAVWPTRD